MNCRVCGLSPITKAGEIEYYTGFKFAVFDCSECQCRFTEHHDTIYEMLHSNDGTCYALQLETAQKAKKLFDAKDLDGLRRELASSSKNKFIVESIERLPKTARILEVGCSRGYLTSYAILAGYDVVGADVSDAVLDFANANFGPHFYEASSPEIAKRAPYDLIYHIGTIGCVEDPVGLTRSLLGMLKPGGKLIFNAPNADACWLRGQLWIDFAPPPDVTTLYRPGFWSRFFLGEAHISEEVEKCPPDYSLAVTLRKLLRRWQPPRPVSVNESYARYKYGPPAIANRFEKLWAIFEMLATRAISKIGLVSLVPAQPSAFGIFLTLTKK